MTFARLAGAGAGFLTQIILARVLGPTKLGIFYAATSFAVVGGIFLARGYPGVTQRFVTRYVERRRPTLLSAFVWQMQLETLLTALPIVVLLVVAMALWPASLDTHVTFAASVLSMMAMASFNIYAAFALANRRFSVALLPETLVRPVLFLIGVCLLAFTGAFISAGEIAVLYAGLSGLLALVQYWLISSCLPPRTGVQRSRRLGHRWRREARPLVLVALFTTLFADLATFAATPFLSLDGLAAFGVCVKITMLVGFAVQVAQQVALPDLAAAHERQDSVAMRQALLRAAVFPTGVTLAATVLALGWGDLLLGLFGPEFVSAKWVLALMTWAQFLRAAAGPSVHMLTLTGSQRLNAMICLACCAGLFAADALLIPVFGLAGAGLAAVATYAAWILATAAALWRRRAIRTDLAYLTR
jgi:O-antigen/teichoic acid export membrane protein